MQIVITGGPASEPIDQVRFITNRSTGELAVKLAQRFLAAGHDVELFLGRGASWHLETAKYFQTNEDFGVAKAIVSGRASDAAKISSGAELVELRLVPKPKLIRRLRGLFANAFIVGWKFELEGTPTDVVREGIQQIESNGTNACIVNGGAFGPGFGFCTRRGLVRTLPTKDALSEWLLEVVARDVVSDFGDCAS
jgi:phosphopantothenoylcysteine synthetase/decarboxylase